MTRLLKLFIETRRRDSIYKINRNKTRKNIEKANGSGSIDPITIFASACDVGSCISIVYQLLINTELTWGNSAKESCEDSKQRATGEIQNQITISHIVVGSVGVTELKEECIKL